MSLIFHGNCIYHTNLYEGGKEIFLAVPQLNKLGYVIHKVANMLCIVLLPTNANLSTIEWRK